nr:efflux RND transporter permease subunit [Chitinophagales bacterium]
QFKNADILNDIVIKTTAGGVVHLKDIAEIKDTYKEKESYARYNGKNVITLSVIKRSGENLIDASDKIRLIIEKLKTEEFPKSLDVSISGDMSENTRTTRP